MTDFERGFHDIPSDPLIGDFAKEHFPACPLCGAANARWTTRERYGMNTRILFKCAGCGAVLSVTASDLFGRASSMMSVEGIVKTLSGKLNRKLYAKVESIGTAAGAEECLGHEYPLDALYALFPGGFGHAD